MDKFVKLGQDMVLLWSKYKVMYWAGIWNTLKLALARHTDRLLHRPAVRCAEYHPLYEERPSAQAVPAEAAARSSSASM